MNIEEHGRFYIERKHTPPPVSECFEVGDVVIVGGTKRYHPSADHSFPTKAEALEWIKKQP